MYISIISDQWIKDKNWTLLDIYWNCNRVPSPPQIAFSLFHPYIWSGHCHLYNMNLPSVTVNLNVLWEILIEIERMTLILSEWFHYATLKN